MRIQFAWQRGAASNPGGLAHDTDEKGNALGNDASGTWVRVAEALAGPNWGSQFTPRIGTEVLVDFIEGDMDRPLVVAQLYTGADTPPISAGVDTEVNHAGVISGIHSNNFDGGGYNQWVVDDTSGQVRTRLATSSAATQLNLGYLVQQAVGSSQRGSYRGQGFELRTDAWAVVRGGEGTLISATARAQQGSGVTSTQLDSAEAVGLLRGAAAAGSAQRGSYRGQGFELRTDAWAVMRGGEGTLISATARTQQGSGVTSTQMDSAEALALLRGASELNTALLDAAGQQKALSSKDAQEAQVDFIAQIDPEQRGKFDGGVGGQDALKASTGARELDAAAPVDKFGQPIVLMEGPASINWATPASTALFAGGQLQWTTQADLYMAAAHTVASVSANATGLFTHDGGIQAVAANGPVSLQAHTDQLEILADKAITVVSVNDVIEIKAQEKIVLQAGQSSVTLEGGNITFACSGNFSVKGSQHIFDSGHRHETRLAKLPDVGVGIIPAAASKWLYDEQIEFRNANNALLANVAYQLKLEDGTVIDGVTDSEGKTCRITNIKPLAIVEAQLQHTGHTNCCGSNSSENDHASIMVDTARLSLNQRDIGRSIAPLKTEEGKSRGLTEGEISEAKKIFFDSIDYAKVKIHNGEYLWFGLQPDDTAMTPNGEIYFNPKHFVEDFSKKEQEALIWFIHEMVHVWQHQLGYPVKWRGAIRLELDYRYTLDESKTLADFNMEAQGNVLADFWALKRYPPRPRAFNERKHINDLSLYEKVLDKFIKNPSDPSNLPGG